MSGLLQPSIARRITVAVVLACTLVWLIIYTVGRYGVFAADTGDFDAEVRVVVDAAQEMAERYTEPRDLAAALAGLGSTIEADERVRGTVRGFLAMQVFDASGQQVAAAGEGPAHWPAADQRRGFFTHDAAGRSFRIYRSVTPDGRLRIEVSQSHASRQHEFNSVMFSGGAFQLLALSVAVLLLPVWLAVHTGLAPLRRLARELAQRHPADLTPIQAPLVYRELAPLARDLNGALARLAALLQRERDFLADAAHQLRTPLALINAQCDTLQHAQAGAAREAALTRLQAGLVRAGRVVNQVLALARLEADVEDTPVATDVADVARDCLAAHAGTARASGMELSYVGPDSLCCHCPGHAVESVLDNLVGNAVRYGREGGQVELRVAALQGGTLQVQVSDDGPGIAPADLPQLFERFRRGTDALTTGSGLGLAIVKSAARQLGAHIEVLPGLNGRGVGFRLSWPATPAATLPGQTSGPSPVADTAHRLR
jgi:two-component system sensor histidine kinase QseC